MKTVALILASLALLACTAESGVDFDKTLTHPNGLVVERPVGFDARRSAEGFRFDEGGKLRNPRQLEVQRQDAPPSPDLASRRLGDGEARYKVEEDDGGSAGSEYRLWAAKPAGARWIVISASEQSEDGEPTFAWPGRCWSGPGCNRTALCGVPDAPWNLRRSGRSSILLGLR